VCQIVIFIDIIIIIIIIIGDLINTTLVNMANYSRSLVYSSGEADGFVV